MIRSEQRLALIAAGAAPLGSLVGGGITLAATTLQLRADRDLFLRSERNEAYADFVAAAQLLHEATNRLASRGEPLEADDCAELVDVDQKYSDLLVLDHRLLLVAPTSTTRSANDVVATFSRVGPAVVCGPETSRRGLAKVSVANGSYTKAVEVFTDQASVDLGTL